MREKFSQDFATRGLKFFDYARVISSNERMITICTGTMWCLSYRTADVHAVFGNSVQLASLSVTIISFKN
ncbi:hypothetical protein WN51_03310 [Melipona quadrifasciata]|uniref:Uncharacterized protein n=1 Tax=Melipona quadrifasciata TaxID=166423 RepID=A0A0N0U487_9HYME|nr:hypothetical protein WN51_03310 [Melipona quadrifasciata]